MNNDNFAQWTQELLEEERKNGRATNVLQICVENFDVWENELIPLLRKQGKPWYRSIVEMLHKNGNMNANEAMIQKYFSRIRRKRGLTGQKASVASSLTSNRSVEVVPTTIVVSPVAAPKTVPVPEIQPPSHQVQVARPTTAKQVGDQEYPHVFAKGSLTPPVEYHDFEADLASLQEQSRTEWSDWSGIDEGHWLSFLNKIESYNMTYSPKWTVDGNQTEFWKYLEQKDDISMFKLLKKKVVVKRAI